MKEGGDNCGSRRQLRKEETMKEGGDKGKEET